MDCGGGWLSCGYSFVAQVKSPGLIPGNWQLSIFCLITSDTSFFPAETYLWRSSTECRRWMQLVLVTCQSGGEKSLECHSVRRRAPLGAGKGDTREGEWSHGGPEWGI